MHLKKGRFLKLIELEIYTDGTARLHKETDGKDKTYYLVLSVNLEAGNTPRNYPATAEQILIPISEEQYKRLEQALDVSEAERPVLKVEGVLEVILKAACIN